MLKPRFNLFIFFACFLTLHTNVLAYPNSQPNVLFLLSDDQRPDTIAALGNRLIKTPHLDELVRSGTSFTRATCAYPICTPSRAEIMSGCNSFKNGVLDFGRKINPELTLWATAMREAGYRTGYAGKWHNDGRPHLRGYDKAVGMFAGGGKRDKSLSPYHLHDQNGQPITGYRNWVFQTSQGKILPQKGTGLYGDISETFADAAIEFIKQKSKQPFFLHVNFAAPHDPLLYPSGYEKMYDAKNMPLPGNFLPQHPFDHGNYSGRDESLWPWPRKKEDVQKELAVYYAVISHMDAQIGRIIAILKQTKQLNNTIIIFASDHGLSIGSHGLRGKQSMYEHTIGVPLIFAGPGITSGKKTDAQCYLRDIFPTVCELTNIDIPQSVQGKSLVPVIQGKLKSVYSHIFGYFRNFQRMVRSDEWKLIYYPHLGRSQLFNLRADPLEINDLSTDKEFSGQLQELRAKLKSWQLQINDPALQIKPGIPPKKN